jgi:hypothetical protein
MNRMSQQRTRQIGTAAQTALWMTLGMAVLSGVAPDARAGTVAGATFGVGVSLSALDYRGNYFYPSLRAGVQEAYDISSHHDGYPPVEIHLQADANATGPTATVQGEITGPTYLIGSPLLPHAAARVEYWISIQPRNGLYDVTEVPVTVIANVYASHTGKAGAMAIADTPVGSISAGNCHPDFDYFCPSTSSGNAVGGMARVGDNFMSVYAAGFGFDDSTFTAAADPVMTIDDIFIPGTSVSYRDAFDLEVSAGITQQVNPPGAPVPEPATTVLLGLGLCALGWVRRRA